MAFEEILELLTVVGSREVGHFAGKLGKSKTEVILLDQKRWTGLLEKRVYEAEGFVIELKGGA
jgi:hypothetical protein